MKRRRHWKLKERADFESGARLSGENPAVVAQSRCSAASWTLGILNGEMDRGFEIVWTDRICNIGCENSPLWPKQLARNKDHLQGSEIWHARGWEKLFPALSQLLCLALPGSCLAMFGTPYFRALFMICLTLHSIVIADLTWSEIVSKVRVVQNARITLSPFFEQMHKSHNETHTRGAKGGEASRYP